MIIRYEGCRRERRGFTLIELLVVIAIIAILSAILFPVFSRSREKARQTTCQSNLKQIGQGLLMYAQDYDEWFPPAYNSFGTAGQSRYWADFLAPYVGVKGKYDKNASPCYANTIFDCSSLESQLIVPTDYLYFRVLWAYWSGGTNEWAQYNDMTRIMKPSEVGVVADSEGSEWGNPTSNAGIGVLGEKVSSQRLRNRHSEGLNILYCDGHVKWQRASIGDNLANIFDESKHR